jgi:ADP-ribosyl-[dinitrogen reductase] hydrolase
MKDRQRGTLIGLAVGDALGAAVEFMSPGTFKPVTGYRGGGPHGLGPGEWTDDTSMALALADSIAKVGWDLNDQADRYIRWWRKGDYSVNGRCFDIGIATRGAPGLLNNRVSQRTAVNSAFQPADILQQFSLHSSRARIVPRCFHPIGSHCGTSTTSSRCIR